MSSPTGSADLQMVSSYNKPIFIDLKNDKDIYVISTYMIETINFEIRSISVFVSCHVQMPLKYLLYIVKSDKTTMKRYYLQFVMKF